MPRNLRLSLSVKYTLVLLVPLAIGIAILAFTLAQMIERRAESAAEQTGRSIAEAIGASLKAVLNEQMAATRSLADSIVAAHATASVSRDQVTALMRHTLEKNDGMYGIWSCWEPDAIDGRDREHIGVAGNDGHGRYANYVVRHVNDIGSEPLQGYDTTPPLDYYALPKNSLRESVVEPYGYEQDGRWMLLTTFAEPLIVDGRFVGAVGSDINLESLRKIVAAARPLETGRVSLVSANGMWISDIDSSQIGKAIAATDPTLAALLPDMTSGRPGFQRARSAADRGVDVLRIYTPLSLGRSGTNWSVVVTVPTASLYTQAFWIRNVVFGAGLTLAAILVVAVVICTRLFIGRPLSEIASRLRSPREDDQAALERLGRRPDEVGLIAGGISLLRETERDRRRLAEEAAIGGADAAHAASQLAAGLGALAKGNLDTKIDGTFAPSLDRLRTDFNDTIDRLRSTVGGIQANALALHEGTTEIGRASAALAERTEHQAVNLEETAAALDGITHAVVESAGRAQLAQELTQSAKARSEESIVKVQSAIAKMAAITDSTHLVTKGLSIIQGIASQSSLLALNAAIEAASAGDAGRGFSVVATEVRELARRSADAAGAIEQLIVRSTEDVKAGVTLVGDTAQALDAIVVEITKAYDAVATIAVSAQDQAVALRQTNTIALELDRATQENAAMAEETMAASTSLEEQSKNLMGLTDWFSIRNAAIR